MIKIINKNNWTGQKASIRINQNKKTLSLFGVCGSPVWEVFKIKRIRKNCYEVLNKNWDYPVAKVYKAFNGIYMAENYNVLRESKCIYTAIAQTLFNVL